MLLQFPTDYLTLQGLWMVIAEARPSWKRQKNASIISHQGIYKAIHPGMPVIQAHLAQCCFWSQRVGERASLSSNSLTPLQIQ